MTGENGWGLEKPSQSRGCLNELGGAHIESGKLLQRTHKWFALVTTYAIPNRGQLWMVFI
jgi:hypothetical protein